MWLLGGGLVWCGLVGEAADASCRGTEALLVVVVVVWGSGSGIGREARAGFAPGRLNWCEFLMFWRCRRCLLLPAKMS